jgi:GT2 family glycosyltransferase
MGNPLVSIIILNWNGKNLLQECLSSVLKSSYTPIEVLFVDNDSTDGSVDIVKANFPTVNILENGENLGYAEGNNRGVAIAKGKYVVTLNNDIIVESDWLDKPIEYLEKDEMLFAANGIQMNYFRRSEIESLFHYPGADLLMTRAGFGETIAQNSRYLKPGYILAVNGGSGIYRKEMFLKMGGFDRRFMFYHEETDLCMRAFLNGLKCLFVPQSVVYHKQGETFKKYEGKKQYFNERNKFWFIFKNFPLSFIFRSIRPIAIEEMRAIKRDVFVSRAPMRYLKPRIDALRGMVKYLKQRKANVKRFGERKNEFLIFQRERIIPLTKSKAH